MEWAGGKAKVCQVVSKSAGNGSLLARIFAGRRRPSFCTLGQLNQSAGNEERYFCGWGQWFPNSGARG